MIFYGNGVVWDAAKHKRLCIFEGGKYETENPVEIQKLKKLGYESEGEEPKEPDNEPAREDKSALIEEAVRLDLAAPSTLKRWSVEKLKGAINGTK